MGEESEFQSKVIALAKKCGWRVYHTVNARGSAKGFPDLVLVHPARKLVLFREIKSDGGSISKEQWDWLCDLGGAGANAGIWRPHEWPEIERILTQ